jgi:hypothetical protein
MGFQVPNLQDADVTFRGHAAVPHRLLRQHKTQNEQGN